MFVYRSLQLASVDIMSFSLIFCACIVLYFILHLLQIKAYLSFNSNFAESLHYVVFFIQLGPIACEKQFFKQILETPLLA